MTVALLVAAWLVLLVAWVQQHRQIWRLEAQLRQALSGWERALSRERDLQQRVIRQELAARVPRVGIDRPEVRH